MILGGNLHREALPLIMLFTAGNDDTKCTSTHNTYNIVQVFEFKCWAGDFILILITIVTFWAHF